MICFCVGYTWSWVNHDVNYVDPITGDHTNKIESSWFAVKRQLPRGGKYDLKRSVFSTEKNMYSTYFNFSKLSSNYSLHQLSDGLSLEEKREEPRQGRVQ